jgi:predicted DNA-binding protein
MSYLIAGSSKVKIAVTIPRRSRDRINKIMERTGKTLTDVVDDLIIIGLDASNDMELASGDETERRPANDTDESLHELGL